MMSNRSDIALLIDKEITNQGISRVGLCIQVVFSKPLDGENVFPYFSTRLRRVVESIDECDLNELVNQLFDNSMYFVVGAQAGSSENFYHWILKFVKPDHWLAVPLYRLQQNLLGFDIAFWISEICQTICFIYCILSFLYPCAKNRERPSNYSDKIDRLVFDRSSMPMKLRDIPKFETNNSLAITVSSRDDDGLLFCGHRSKLKGNFRKVFLLLLTDGLNFHYCLIMNFQNLMHKLCRSLGKAEKGRRTNLCELYATHRKK